MSKNMNCAGLCLMIIWYLVSDTEFDVGRGKNSSNKIQKLPLRVEISSGTINITPSGCCITKQAWSWLYEFIIYCENSSNMQKDIFQNVFRVLDFFLYFENICDCDLFIAAPGCMSDFFPNPRQLEIFDASSEQICCSTVRLVPCVLPAQYEKYLNK